MNETMLRAAFEPARALEPTDAELARALRVRRRRRWPALFALGAVLVVGGTATAVEPLHGVLANLVDRGRPVAADDHAPDWIHATGTRVLAEAGGEQLYVEQRGDTLEFGLGTSVGLGGSAESWREQFADAALVVLGPGKRPRANGTRVVFGLTARAVQRVELVYTSGPPTRASSAEGAFALLADATRELRTLIAYDAAGAEVERKDMTYMELRVCPDVRGCPPGEYEPKRSGG